MTLSKAFIKKGRGQRRPAEDFYSRTHEDHFMTYPADYEKQEGVFQAHDGLKLYYRHFRHRDEMGRLLILHGHGEHSGRYEKFAAELAPLKLSIAMMDLRGHGRSEGRRVFVNSFEDYLRDVDSFAAFLEAQNKRFAPFILLGHSKGGLLAVLWAMRFPEKLKGLVLSSPCLGLKFPAFLIGFNRALRHLAPWFVYRNPVYPPYLTHNLEELARYKRDTLIQRKISPALLDAMIRAMKDIKDVSHVRFPFPVMILASGLEKVVDLDQTRAFYEKLETPSKELKIFEGYYHEIFNELGQEKVFEALKGALNRMMTLERRLPGLKEL